MSLPIPFLTTYNTSSLDSHFATAWIFLPYKKKPWICKFREPWSGRPRVRSFHSEQEALDFEKVQRLIFEREKALVRRARYKGRQPERTLTVVELLSAYIEARQSLSTRTTAMQHLCNASEESHAFTCCSLHVKPR